MEIRKSSGRFSAWKVDQMPSAVSSTFSFGANSRSTPKNCPMLVLSNRTILTLSCHPHKQPEIVAFLE
jgi:hypothetical protein